MENLASRIVFIVLMIILAVALVKYPNIFNLFEPVQSSFYNAWAMPKQVATSSSAGMMDWGKVLGYIAFFWNLVFWVSVGMLIKIYTKEKKNND